MNNTVASKVKAKQLLLFDEQYVHAMRLFTQETLRSTKEKNHFESADNIYYIAECLLQLRRLDKVEKVLNKCADFIKLHNRNISIAFKNLQGKYFMEKGKYTACVDLLLPIKNTIQSFLIQARSEYLKKSGLRVIIQTPCYKRLME